MAGRVVEQVVGWEARAPRLLGDVGDPEARVGLYATEQEAQRVVDLLRLKTALDGGQPLEAVPLHLPIEDYTGNSSTMQYLQDSDVDTVWNTFRACGAEQLQPERAAVAAATAWAAGPAGGMGPTAARGWWEQGEEESEEADEGLEEEAADTQQGNEGSNDEGAEPAKGQEEAEEDEEERRSGGEDRTSDEDWEAGRRHKEQGTGRLNAAGRPLRVAAVRRKLPLPAPGEVESGTPSSTKRQRPPAPAASKQQQQCAALVAAHEAQQVEEEEEGQQQPQGEEPAGKGLDGGGDSGMGRRRAATKTIIFPPVPASMKCNKCINCQNPQRKRPCVLARRRLLELLREQEQGLAGEGDGGDGGSEAGNGGDAAPAATDSDVPISPGSCRGGGRGNSTTAVVAAALHVPPRKQLYPIIPPSERCGQCKPCLNPRLKKACREARKRQLAGGIATPYVQQAFDGRSLRSVAAIGSTTPRASGKGAKGKAAAAAAVAAGRQLGPSLVGCRVRIYWPGMRRWYEGRVTGFEHSTGQHHIEYDDGDQQLHLLAQEKHVLLDPPRPLVPGNGSKEEEEEEAVVAADTPAAKRVRHDTPGGRAGESGDSFNADGRKSGAAAAPATPASVAGTPLQASALPKGGDAASPLLPAVVQLPAALAACCRSTSTGGRSSRAAAAGITSSLLGRFMAAFSCKMSAAQRQEHATFLLPMLEAGCFEGVQACMEEVVLLCRSQQKITAGTVPASPVVPPSQLQQE